MGVSVCWIVFILVYDWVGFFFMLNDIELLVYWVFFFLIDYLYYIIG